jgi:hypothetical protein
MASPNLTETKSLILSMASQRDDGRVVLPGSLKGAAARVVLRSLERRGYVVSTDVPATLPGLGHPPAAILQPFRITSAGLAAIGSKKARRAMMRRSLRRWPRTSHIARRRAKARNQVNHVAPTPSEPS